MKKIIITAFAPFGPYPVNSTQLVLDILRRGEVFEIIPVVYEAIIPANNRGKELVDMALAHGASGILSLGMASEKRGVCIEKYVSNVIDSPKYCPPELQKTAIRADRAYGEKVNLDLDPWCIELFSQKCKEEGIPMEDSTDAGGFCCNHLAYQTRLALLESGTSLPFLFVHFPCCTEAVPNMDDFMRAGKVAHSPELMSKGIVLLLSGARL